MSDDAQLITIAGSAAAALVSEMVRATWSSTREIIARLFRHGGKEEEERQLIRLDEDRKGLADLGHEEVQSRWQRRLLTLVEDFPDAVNELQELAGLLSDEQSKRVTQNATGNTAPVIQSGRDNFGGLNIEGR